jgi:hypothetical protein
MKLARLLLIVFGIVALLCGIAVGLAMTPSLQRWALLRAVGEVPGLRLDVTSVSGGFSGVTLRDVRAEYRQGGATVDSLEVDFSVLGFIVGRNLNIDRLHASGLRVDASRISRAEAGSSVAGAPAVTPGLLAQLELPFDLTLDDVRIEGTALLPGSPGQPPIGADYVITGGGFFPGKEGLLQLNATVRDPAPEAEVTELRVQAGLRATLTPHRSLDKISLTSLVDAEGKGLASTSQLKVSADLFRVPTGEDYDIAISTVLQGASENVLNLHAKLLAGGRQYEGDWDLKVRTEQLKPFFLGWALPDFDVKGGGRFALDPAVLSFSMQGDVRGQVSGLEIIEPTWRAFGLLKMESSFDVTQQEGILRFERFKALVSSHEPVLEISTATPVRYDFGRRQLWSDNLGSDKLFRVLVHGLPVDWVRPFVTGADVSGGMITGEVDVIRARASGPAAMARGSLKIDDLNIVQSGRPLLAKAEVVLKTETSLAEGRVEVPALALNVTTPAGDSLALNGRLGLEFGAMGPLSFAGTLNATATQLLSPWLPGTPVHASGEIDFTLRDQRLEFRPGRLELRQGTGRALLNLTTKQPFALELTSYNIAPDDAARPVARIELGRLPLTLLPVTEPGTSLGGFVSQGDFELSASGGKVVVSPIAPLRLTDVSVSNNKQAQLVGLVIQALPAVEYSPTDGMRIQTGDTTVWTAKKETLLAFKADVSQSATKDMQAAVTFALEMPALASQPLFADARSLSAGRATGEIRAVWGTQNQLETRMTLNGLMSADTNQTLPVANLSFRGVMHANGSVSVEAPLLLDNAGRRSDLNFALELSPLGRGYSIDGRLTGQHVELEDLLGVLGVFVASAVPDNGERPAPSATIPPDTVAAWSRISGHLGLAIESVTRGQDWVMSGLAGTVAIDPTRLALNKLEASFTETSRLAAKMEMRFTGGAMPYRLTGDYVLSEFDTGKLFKALEPEKPPTVEGLFNVKATFSGNGETPARAIDRVQGELEMTSSQGIFRGLQRTTGKVSMASKAVELGASVLGSILGSGTATKTAEKVAGQAYFVDQLAQSVGEFNYDQLSVRLSRDELLNTNLESISLVSPEIRLTGRGTISHVVGRPLLEQPLTAALSFGARGKVEQLLGKMRLLSATKDELGYSQTKETITLGGTLAKPDPTAFFSRIATAKLADFLDTEE